MVATRKQPSRSSSASLAAMRLHTVRAQALIFLFEHGPRTSGLSRSPRIPHRWKSKFYGAFVLNRRVVLHAIDATPARWRGDAGSSPLDGARTAASSPRNEDPSHWLISTQSRTKAERAVHGVQKRLQEARVHSRHPWRRGHGQRRGDAARPSPRRDVRGLRDPWPRLRARPCPVKWRRNSGAAALIHPEAPLARPCDCDRRPTISRVRRAGTSGRVWKSASVSGAPDNSSLSHVSAMTRPCWLEGRGEPASPRHRAGVASMAWRRTRRFSTRRKL